MSTLELTDDVDRRLSVGMDVYSDRVGLMLSCDWSLNREGRQSNIKPAQSASKCQEEDKKTTALG